MTNECNSFEENLKKIEENIRYLEKGNLPLKEVIEKFEEGLKISNLCIKELEITKQKIEKVIEENGEIKTEPFDIK
jgi:exodeoxyribonuclease VII small subunit